MEPLALTDLEFTRFQRLIHDIAGISLSQAKKALVSGRLGKRLRELKLGSYSDYLALIARKEARDELQMAVDLLTTNETYFFREPKHFEFLRRYAAARRGQTAPFRVWSAACSSGEEAYTIAMVLADALGDGAWDVFASDISQRVLTKAQAAVYPLERAESIPGEYLRRFCLRGVGNNEGCFTIEPGVRSRVRFSHLNLNSTLGKLGEFDIIFLRNVMIYFDAVTKRQVVDRVASFLTAGGYLLVSHSESLHGVSDALESVGPSIYRKPA